MPDTIQELSTILKLHIQEEGLQSESRHKESCDKINLLNVKIESIMQAQAKINAKLDPIVGMFNTFPIIKQITTCIAAFVIAMAAIGGAVIWFIKQVKKK